MEGIARAHLLHGPDDGARRLLLNDGIASGHDRCRSDRAQCLRQPSDGGAAQCQPGLEGPPCSQSKIIDSLTGVGQDGARRSGLEPGLQAAQRAAPLLQRQPESPL